MTDSEHRPLVTGVATPLEKAQTVARALSDAARRTKFSARARSAYRGDSFESRRGTRALRIAVVTFFFLMVAIPNLIAILYFGFLASDQYVAEAKFTVGSGIIPKMDGFGSVTGVPPAIIVQDTQVVTDYIHSRPMVESLERLLNLRGRFSDRSIDWWARFPANKPVEKFVRYWSDMTSTSIALPSGIVTLQVRAFTAEDAVQIARSVIKLSEDLINELNRRMWNDTVLAAERDLEESAKLLAKARSRIESVRNSEALLEIGQTGKALSSLMTGLQSDLLKAEQEYKTQRRYVSESAPQIRVLQLRIAAIKLQLKEIQDQMTQNEGQPSTSDVKTLSGKMTKYAEAELEQRIAEKRYALSSAALEASRMLNERRLLYLHEAISPSLPQEPKYPRRWLAIGITAFVSFLSWICTVGALSFVRNYMA